ncbi:hypothetical protein DZF91_28005 [Actinomadura logoneensis]|uniref:Uncharacterized protein n=1 Tax=Actinomadura logoneensis TaxID=2293572 RepID=A0A372JED8_9ACTN|nr:DUF6544 family protein [Actinomadura logoneensis]RFU38377.1 hypothetical protein DZF91_28005 [Actinomadura logoneensis]
MARPAAESPARRPGLTEDARHDWARLTRPSGPVGMFTPEQTSRLPVAARHWLLHAIAPGTPLLTTARLEMHGRIRIAGHWWPFDAEQVLKPSLGFVWAATARTAGLPVTGFDEYHEGRGVMRWRVLDRIPLITASGPDVSRSAAGRLAAEFVLAPAAALSPSVQWEHLDDMRAVAHVSVGADVHPVTLTVHPSGRLVSVTVPRWGNPGGGAFGEHLFGVRVQRERTFGGFTIPSLAQAGWGLGTPDWTEGEFFRFAVDGADYR